MLLGFLSPAKGLLEMDERQPRVPRAFSPKGVPRETSVDGSGIRTSKMSCSSAPEGQD